MKLHLSSCLSVILGWLLVSPFAFAQNPSIVIQPDIRVFSVLSALHVAGWDPGNFKPNPARTSILQDFQNVPPELKARLTKFYQDHLDGKKAESQLSKYISLALLSEGPPDFKLSLDVSKLPPEVTPIAEFMGLTKELYAVARLEAVWSANREFYDLAVATYRPLIDQIILKTDGYLRIVSGSFLDRRFLIIPEYLIPPNNFDARTYREIYYLVFGPSERPAADELRHQYLHFILDPFPLRFPLPKETSIALFLLAEKAPEIEDPYRSDQQFLVTESLIRAIELRINKVPEPKLSAELDASIRSGALLTRHFFTSLQFFEPSPEGIRVFYPGMVKGIHIDKIEAEIAEAQKTPVEKKPEPSALQLQLKAANEQLANGALESAAEQFQKILDSPDANNGEALYGLGVVAAMQNKRDQAKDYFLKALQSPSSDRATKVWSHIFLGRIEDLELNRNGAIEHYQAAIQLGDNSRNAQEIAQKGLKEPFKGKSDR
jgi:predicted negative regulator of RcsB-dependent stress response